MCIENLFRFANCAAVMAGQRQHQPGGPTHDSTRTLRCSRPWLCTQLSARGEMFHPGECPACLPGGAIFPLDSFDRGFCEVDRAGHLLMQQQCTEIGQHLLDWCVLWLSGFWNQPEPLGQGPPSVQASLDKAALRHHYASVFCEECGSSGGMSGFGDDPGPCTTCPGVLARAPQTGTASLAILLKTEIARVAYNNKYLAEVKAGKHQNLMTEIMNQTPTPPALTSAQAEQLVHRRWPAPDLIQGEQQPLDAYLNNLTLDLHLFYASETNSGISLSEKTEWHRFTDLAGKILGVASWVLAADTGLHPRHRLQILRCMSPALLHPQVPIAAAQYTRRESCVPVTRAAIMGYLRLPDPEGTIDRMLVVLRDVYTKIQSRRATEVDARRRIKEELFKSRLAYHTERLTQPPDDAWMCSICWETDGETDGLNLTKLACGHILHHQCMMNFGVHGEGQNPTTCPYCRDHWDGIMYGIEETTCSQEDPWYEYDLAGVGE